MTLLANLCIAYFVLGLALSVSGYFACRNELEGPPRLDGDPTAVRLALTVAFVIAFVASSLWWGPLFVMWGIRRGSLR